MANTRSAKKALKQSYKKKAHNLFWKKKIKAVSKTITGVLEVKSGVSAGNSDILNKEQAALQKLLDKAAKNKVIHKNKANRLKSRYAKKIAAQVKPQSKSQTQK
ncbi:MAG TPA: 30S ribosomal protein S20 [Patescibacteria group bacterium]|nr:30S ribosomal protein S20 [Patescibacteria group bacterium]